ncbi:MAG: carbamate kinase [Candidatus Cloacimonetes bacterium]|jgi:carbamate kinase|nr:carbamate kinase [Candidatus Cloacimonadota bacterium]MDY0337721.1 carbamate kinase [Candidatus Cloacimonadaceae bacterium]MCK9336183.1 carbamate kinase [Candidatus Cloacimonadota bacterium]MDD2544238.1 carbamate kinase [Candidatus Cloacimonadota bacterium]MDD3097357.1 carbamate kinase [Candidatus Cloacimonadota bacterium]
MKKTAVLALGGNAIIRAGQKGTISEQFANTRDSLDGIVELISRGYQLSITHGNGPQVGNLLRQQEAGEKEGLAALPLGVLNAATEGTMGYMIEQSLQNKLHEHGIDKQVITIVSQVVVDKNDPSMLNPTKYVGSTYYSAEQAEELKNTLGWTLKEDSGKGYRRVVPSPIPIEIIPAMTINELVHRGEIVIAVGGGGIPVYREESGKLEGVDAVIDKDFASALLALNIKADLFVILTGVDKVAINYGKENQQFLDTMTVAEAQKHYDDRQFPAGSMGPKIMAAIDFLKRGGSEVLITSIEKIVDAFEGKTGTRIVH